MSLVSSNAYDRLPAWARESVQPIYNKRDFTVEVTDMIKVRENLIAVSFRMSEFLRYYGETDGIWEVEEAVFLLRPAEKLRSLYYADRCEYIDVLHLSRTRKSLVIVLKSDTTLGVVPYRYRELRLISEL